MNCDIAAARSLADPVSTLQVPLACQPCPMQLPEPICELTHSLCAGTNFLIRSNAFNECGWMPEYTLTEDYALGMELKMRQWQVYLALIKQQLCRTNSILPPALKPFSLNAAICATMSRIFYHISLFWL